MKFIDRVNQLVKESPDKILLSDWKGEYQVNEIWSLSGRVYRYLTEHGVGKEDVVMVHLPRCADVIMISLGIWRAGAAVTIQEDWVSEDWVESAKRDASCRIVIDNDLLREILKQDPKDGWAPRDLHNLAYITYTTGTTGERKGVMHEYGSFELMVDFFSITNEGWPLPENYRTGLTTSLHSAIPSIVYSVAIGGYMDIVPIEITNDFTLFRKRLIEKKITYTYMSPVLLERLAILDSPYLQCIGTSFEPATNMCSMPIPILNEYGMTESPIVIAEFVIDKEYDIVPIGKPVNPDETFLLDKNDMKVIDGEIGEICFVNHYCRGYLNKPEATAAQFRNGIFHTRDLGQMQSDGNWLMLGRMNDSIETPEGLVVALEIEVAARKVTKDRNLYVKVFPGSSKPVICVYAEKEIDLEFLRDNLSKSLPEYKLPTDFVLVDSFKYNNGKVIRLNLKNPIIDA